MFSVNFSRGRGLTGGMKFGRGPGRSLDTAVVRISARILPDLFVVCDSSNTLVITLYISV